ncbi:MAG: beta-N-acetylhexosaminidase [Marivibrio sp.]|uniref:beta-N-acetylhexosaminidase n=1 Tax=Marivibrio sp. TaxID=2039719 RepID=UPI0032EC5364
MSDFDAFSGVRAAAIFGCGGPGLQAEERAFFRDVRPLGFILFARNVASPDQLRRLTADLRETVDDPAAPILIDQEGGRVQRLKPPLWRAMPAMAPIGRLYERDPAAGEEALGLDVALIAAELRAVGVDVNCAPVLDVPAPDGHEIIGDRAFSSEPETVAALGRLSIDLWLQQAILPVAKHIPGHGRASADSHHELPRVTASRAELNARDFPPFAAASHAPLGMTAHIVYDALDPDRPATASSAVLGDLVRGAWGFDGLLMTDDLSMKALSGDYRERAQTARAAGCDVILHCNGRMDEMRPAVEGAGALDANGARRWLAARVRKAAAPAAFDADAAQARLDALLAGDG